MTGEAAKTVPSEAGSTATRILDAAEELFAERGFSATRLEDVAARAGLSKAAIYLYFDDKTALLKAVVKETVGARIAQLAAVAGHRDGDAAPVIKRTIRLLAESPGNKAGPSVVPRRNALYVSSEKSPSRSSSLWQPAQYFASKGATTLS